MSTTTRSAKAPTHEVFAVAREEGKDKGHWQKIGACWPHDDGDGFNLRLDYLPLNGSELVIRKWKPKPETATAKSREG
ncbi:MAG: hypothetical protein ACLP7P_09720 [Rhodomicrobium sp.]